ncbi:MFS transporter [Enemella evansiae]|uniref:MFS transporter n=1 Tax=Enemella evansiae TaxID=2016499 RepID=UPI000B962BD5|nr:MFS transporter [Enemella evansiae]OYN98026.1 MFS transporter [Enemella evansiae]
MTQTRIPRGAADGLGALDRKVAFRLVPLLALGYLIAYLDRVNVGMAKLQMQSDLGLSDAAYGLGAGLFFVSYILLEVPSNHIVTRVGARVWMARIMITWGILTAVTSLVHADWQFYLLRFLIGAAEAGFFPGVLYYLTLWFPTILRGRIISYFILGLPVASMIGNPVGGWIMKTFHHALGLSGWQWLFIVLGVVPVVVGICYLFALPRSPESAQWLSEQEKAQLRDRLRRDSGGTAAHGAHSFRRALCSGRVWLLGYMCFASLMATYCISFWLPTFIADTGTKDPQTVGLLSAIPAACGALALLLNGWHSDRTRERRWHIAVPLTISAVAFTATTFFSGQLLWVIVLFTIANAALVAHYAVFWCLPGTFLHGPAAAAGFALVSSIGNVGGLFATYAVGWIRDAAGSASPSIWLFAAVLLSSAIVALRLPAREVDR